MGGYIFLSDSDHTSKTFLRYCLADLSLSGDFQLFGPRSRHSEFSRLWGAEKVSDSVHSLSDRQNSSGTVQKLIDLNLDDYLIVPIDYGGLQFLAENLSKLSLHYRCCPVAEVDLIRFLDDKANIPEIATDLEADYPRDRSLAGMLNTESVLIKPRLGSTGSGIVYCNSKKEVASHLAGLSEAQRDDFIMQEYIAGVDYSYYAMAAEGKVLVEAGFEIRQLREYGEKARAAVFYMPDEVKAVSRKLVARYAYSGPISIDYRLDTRLGHEKIVIIEVNPRSGSHSHYFLATGLNLLEVYIRSGELRSLNWGKLKKSPEFRPTPRGEIWMVSRKRFLLNLFTGLARFDFRCAGPLIRGYRLQIYSELSRSFRLGLRRVIKR